MSETELQERLFRFALNVILMLRTLKRDIDLNIISTQLCKAATSSGANYEEAQGAVSRADFSCKVGISLKEMRESNYWSINSKVAPRSKKTFSFFLSSFSFLPI